MRGEDAAVSMPESYEIREKREKLARKKNPRIGNAEKKAEAAHSKADFHRAVGDMHSAKARAMLVKVTSVMSKSGK